MRVFCVFCVCLLACLPAFFDCLFVFVCLFVCLFDGVLGCCLFVYLFIFIYLFILGGLLLFNIEGHPASRADHWTSSCINYLNTTSDRKQKHESISDKPYLKCTNKTYTGETYNGPSSKITARRIKTNLPPPTSIPISFKPARHILHKT